MTEKMQNNSITIDDIAAELGVSKTTVSRAISGKGRISDSTRRRILAYIEALHYKPNAVARGLAQQKTFNIGVVCPTDYEIFDYPFFHRCLRGISEATSGRGYDILISMIEGTRLDNLKRVVDDRKVDGIILTRTLLEDPTADYLKRSGMPFVVIGSSPDEELVQIDNDHFSACVELTQILLAKGFRRLALVGRDERQVITDTRRRGFEEACETAGFPADPELMRLDAMDARKVGEIVRSLAEKRADAIVCMDENIAEMVLTACRELGIRTPEDIRIASFYNSQTLEHLNPPVTAIDIDDRKLGGVAAETLLAMIDGWEMGSQLISNYQIILRESTK